MVKILRDFFKEEDGLGTVEIVLLLAILVGLALIFRKAIVGFVSSILGNTMETKGEFDTQKIGDTPAQPASGN
ncbi:Flp1 family type IVb pilin [Wukongibacter sp. M2B1]|uniref:Flp1 family type IVb pilin n=1 Tax=Wukongibacter sp. M2B1 TaxID=3088895 RepID=UPI003D7A9E7F